MNKKIEENYSENQLIKQVYCDENNKITTIIYNKYDIYHKIIERRECALKDIYIKKYDDNGNIREEIGYDINGEVEYIRRYKYNKKGNKTEEIRLGRDEKLENIRYFIYDDEGYEIEEKWHGSNGKLGWRYLTKRKEKGKIIIWLYYDDNGKVYDRSIYCHNEDGTIYKEIRNIKQ